MHECSVSWIFHSIEKVPWLMLSTRTELSLCAKITAPVFHSKYSQERGLAYGLMLYLDVDAALNSFGRLDEKSVR